MDHLERDDGGFRVRPVHPVEPSWGEAGRSQGPLHLPNVLAAGGADNRRPQGPALRRGTLLRGDPLPRHGPDDAVGYQATVGLVAADGRGGVRAVDAVHLPRVEAEFPQGGLQQPDILPADRSVQASISHRRSSPASRRFFLYTITVPQC
jgi:hypothetical protein